MPDLRKALHGDGKRSEGLQGVPAEAGSFQEKIRKRSVFRSELQNAEAVCVRRGA